MHNNVVTNMGKTGRWIKNFLTGKKSSSHQPTAVDIHENPSTPPSVSLTTLKDKRRWSFRKPSNTEICYKEICMLSTTATTAPDMQRAFSENEQKRHAMEVKTENEQKRHAMVVKTANDQKKHAKAVALSNIADADAAVPAAQAAEVMIRLTYSTPERSNSVEETAATKIQSVFRSYLARKALYALKGLVKLQALVRGHMVRKQAIVTIRCMQALLTVQARARARRISMIDEPNPYNQKLIYEKSSTHESLTHPTHDYQSEENIKIVEMDIGDKNGSAKSRIVNSNIKQTDYRFSNYHHQYSKQIPQHISPVSSAITNMSPRTYSGYFNEHSLSNTRSSPKCSSPASRHDRSNVPFEAMCYEYQLFPNYMANTKSSKAKFRSQSVPKQRPEVTFQRQPSKRRTSIEGRNVTRATRMQRSSSLVNATQNFQYPWSLDKSAVSVKDSECGSNSTILANSHYCRS